LASQLLVADRQNSVLVGCFHVLGIHHGRQSQAALEFAEEPFRAETLIGVLMAFAFSSDRERVAVQRDFNLFLLKPEDSSCSM